MKKDRIDLTKYILDFRFYFDHYDLSVQRRHFNEKTINFPFNGNNGCCQRLFAKRA